MAGVGTAYLASIGGRTTPDVSVLVGGPPRGLLVLALWAAVGIIASLGAARVATQLTSNSPSRPPSILGCTIAWAVGGLAVAFLPDGWLRLLGGAGFLLMLYMALALLAGLVDMALRVSRRSPTS